MERYQVTRKSVRFKRQTYNVGDLLPKEFSTRDLWQVMYPSRVSLVDVPDEEDYAETDEQEQPQETIELEVPAKEEMKAAPVVTTTTKAVSSVSATAAKSASTKVTGTTQKKTLASQPKTNGTLSGTK